jgi:uncharacterized RDD family membrane protein YckC
MTPQTQASYCSECGQPTRPDELARFGDRLICPNCKNTYAQRLREGVPQAGYVRYGGFWIRWVAVLIDALITAIPIGILNAMVFATMGLSMTQLVQNPNPRPEEVFAMLAPMFGMIGLASVLAIGINCAYETFFLVKYGATPGKMAMGLKVVRPDGSGIEVGRAIGRYFAKMLSAMILYIGYIMAGFDAQKRALHDMLCDTRVIKTR